MFLEKRNEVHYFGTIIHKAICGTAIAYRSHHPLHVWYSPAPPSPPIPLAFPAPPEGTSSPFPLLAFKDPWVLPPMDGEKPNAVGSDRIRRK